MRGLWVNQYGDWLHKYSNEFITPEIRAATIGCLERTVNIIVEPPVSPSRLTKATLEEITRAIQRLTGSDEPPVVPKLHQIATTVITAGLIIEVGAAQVTILDLIETLDAILDNRWLTHEQATHWDAREDPLNSQPTIEQWLRQQKVLQDINREPLNQIRVGVLSRLVDAVCCACYFGDLNRLGALLTLLDDLWPNSGWLIGLIRQHAAGSGTTSFLPVVLVSN